MQSCVSVPELNRSIDIDILIDLLTNEIAALEYEFGKCQTVEVCKAGLNIETDIYKSYDEIRIGNIWVCTQELEEVSSLENVIREKLLIVVSDLWQRDKQLFEQTEQIIADRRNYPY